MTSGLYQTLLELRGGQTDPNLLSDLFFVQPQEAVLGIFLMHLNSNPQDSWHFLSNYHATAYVMMGNKR